MNTCAINNCSVYLEKRFVLHGCPLWPSESHTWGCVSTNQCLCVVFRLFDVGAGHYSLCSPSYRSCPGLAAAFFGDALPLSAHRYTSTESLTINGSQTRLFISFFFIAPTSTVISAMLRWEPYIFL